MGHHSALAMQGGKWHSHISTRSGCADKRCSNPGLGGSGGHHGAVLVRSLLLRLFCSSSPGPAVTLPAFSTPSSLDPSCVSVMMQSPARTSGQNNCFFNTLGVKRESACVCVCVWMEHLNLNGNIGKGILACSKWQDMLKWAVDVARKFENVRINCADFWNACNLFLWSLRRQLEFKGFRNVTKFMLLVGEIWMWKISSSSVWKCKKKEKYRHYKGLSLQTNIFLVHDTAIGRGKIKTGQPE